MTQNAFKTFAKRILKAQKKLGALKGLKATTLTLSESRKRNLKQAGLYSAAAISTAALTAAGIAVGKKAGKTETVKKVTGKVPKVKVPKVKVPKMSKKEALIAGAVATPAAAGAIGGGILAASKLYSLNIFFRLFSVSFLVLNSNTAPPAESETFQEEPL